MVLRDALRSKIEPLFGNALWLKYEDLLRRPAWTDATTSEERLQVLAALAKLGRWVNIYYGWRPNLPDEADKHLIELAMAGGASGDYFPQCSRHSSWRVVAERIAGTHAHRLFGEDTMSTLLIRNLARFSTYSGAVGANVCFKLWVSDQQRFVCPTTLRIDSSRWPGAVA